MTERAAQERLAGKIWRLYVIDGTHWYRQHEDGTYSYQARSLELSDIAKHLDGQLTLGIPCSWQGRGKFLAVDIDTLDLQNLRRCTGLLARYNLPHLASLSGGKGYHIELFVEESLSEDLGRMAKILGQIWRDGGVKFDRPLPGGDGWSGRTAGGANWKLPAGIHRKTGRLCSYLDGDLKEVEDLFDLLAPVEPMSLQVLESALGSMPVLHLESGQILRSGGLALPTVLAPRHECVNVLWQEGLQGPSTRDSATMVIAIAVGLNPLFPDGLKEEVVVSWVRRIFPAARQKGYVDSRTTLDYAVSEGVRIYRREASRGFGVTCMNPLLRGAMESACRDEIGCHLKRNGERVDFGLLRRLGVFGPRNSRKPGIRKASGYVYQALQDLDQEFGGKLFVYQGMPAFAAPIRMLQDLSACCETTVKKSLRDLRHIGLVVKVPKYSVPAAFRRKKLPGQKFTLQASYYCLPVLSEELVRGVVLPKARGYGRGANLYPDIYVPLRGIYGYFLPPRGRSG